MDQQMMLDWSRRERSANRTDDWLKELDVPAYQRAIIWIAITHPDAVYPDPVLLSRIGQRILKLRISFREAGRYLKQEPSPFGSLKLSASSQFGASNLSKAARTWKERGVIATPKGHLELNPEALNAWAENQSDLREEAENQWLGASRCVPVCPGVSPSEGEREGSKDNLSFNPSGDTPEHNLPPLPDAAFDLSLDQAALYSAVKDWWIREGMADRGFDPDLVAGAILAARKFEANDIQRYAETCLRNGVKESWRKTAANWRKRHATAVRRDEYGIMQTPGYAPHG